MNRPRVALVSALTPQNTGVAEPSAGVLTLAAILRERYEIQVIDLNVLWNRAFRESKVFHRLALEAIAASAPEIVGFSSICGTYPTTIRLAESIAQVLPDSRIVFGGPHASVVDVPTLAAFPFVDAVVRGEADDIFPACIDAITNGKSLADLDGITYRQGRQISRNRNASVILDLDRLPLPAYDLFPGIEALQSLTLEIGRGCPFSCTFCSTNDFFRRRFRLKSARRVVSQMQELCERYGISSFELTHDMFTVDRRKVAEFCDELNKIGAPFTWSCAARTDCVDRELLAHMRDAGCRGIYFGIETGSQRLQQIIDKGLDLDRAQEILELCDSMGIPTTASMILGYPTETREDLHDTVAFLTRVGRLSYLEPQLHLLSPLPGTLMTTHHWNELYFDEKGLDASESGLLQDPTDRLLIASHKDIFSNFWAIPCPLDRRFLRRAAGFLIYGSLRCNGLVQALRLWSGDMLAVFEVWDRRHCDKSPEYFETPRFVDDLIEFAEQELSADPDPALVVTTRFYRAYMATQTEARARRQPDLEARLSLNSDISLVTVQGDIVRVLDALRREERPGWDCVEQNMTFVVHRKGDQNCGIRAMPRIGAVVLDHARRCAPISEVVRDFEQNDLRFGPLDPSEVAQLTINNFERDGLIHRIPPASTITGGSQSFTSV